MNLALRDFSKIFLNTDHGGIKKKSRIAVFIDGKRKLKRNNYQEWGLNPRGQYVHWNLSPTP